ncbi:MAG TPA: Gfo/Idh/MocA family oxidoreductase, partial [Dehalococcoidales bacterium]|nr:Gfo/Idh/MocA family oxidoreductase [Dehalococcoidales bacterium]
VLLEKPMGCSLAECRDMVNAAKKTGITFMIGHDLRYMPHSLAIKNIVQSGELGSIRVTRCVLIANMLPSGGYRLGNWLSDPKRAGGGIMISGMIHQIDLMRYFVGEIRSVYGLSRSVHPRYLNGAEEYACATLEYENGAIGDVLIISSPARSEVGCQYTLIGDEGTIYSTQAENRTYQFGAGRIASPRRGSTGDAFNNFIQIEPVRGSFPSNDAFINEILHFADCCQGKIEPLTGGSDNLETIKVIFGIYESFKTGQRIELSKL